jgi:hypothetical protein
MQPLEAAPDTEEKEEEEEKDGRKKEKAPKKEKKIGVASMCMNNAGTMIYAGCTDNVIRCYEIKESA